MRSVRGLISGRVQGVGFRYFVRRCADRYGIAGFVRNLADGRVEFLLQGAPQDVDAVVEQIRSGPAHARVSGLDLEDDDQAAIESDFSIR